MKPIFTLLCIILFATANAQNLYFPPTTGNTWDTLSPTSLGWCEDEIDTLLNYLESRNSKAFIVMKDGKIVIEKYFGTFTQDSVWYWASAGKSLTAFAVGLAQQDGFLDIDDTTSQYLGSGWTACTPTQEGLITVRNQLTMTSGLDDGVPDVDCTIDTCLQYLADAGTRWAYHNAPYTLLDSVIFYATGQPLNNYIAQKLFTPTGMSGLYFPVGYNNVFFSKPRSMARYGLLILNGGNWDGNQIMTDTAYFNQMVNTSQSLNLSYGYLWWLNGKASFMVPSLQFVFPGSINPAAPDDMFAAMGKNGQVLNIVPSMNLVFVRMGNSPGGGGTVAVTFNDTIWQHMNQVMGCPLPNGISSSERTALALTVHPNPTQSTLRVNANQGYAIYTLTGTLLQHSPLPTATIDISNLPTGVYIIKLGERISKFVKM